MISRRKWDWIYEGARPLSHLERFDFGSRGSLGAIRLIPTILLEDSIALTAVLLIIPSFLIGPFVQQASRTQECSFPVPGLNASIPYAHYVPARGGYLRIRSTPQIIGSDSPLGFASADLFVAIISSLTSPDSLGIKSPLNAALETVQLRPMCLNSRDQRGKHDQVDNTTHSTVGVCSKCTDVTSLITRREEDGHAQYILPTTPLTVSVTPTFNDSSGSPWSHPVEIYPS